jgi:UDPglucose--hexose-1-phosphate uridylyltransferase
VRLDLQQRSHRRYNALTGQWIVVSPNRTLRPWQGQVEETQASIAPAYDPTCYMCPGNERASGVRNPQYESTYIFDNDFPALQPGAEPAGLNEHGLIVAASESGVCRVLCFSPRHDLTLSTMSTPLVRKVVDAWAEQCADLAASSEINYVQIFENSGPMMGASNPHPHGQIWASASIPNEPAVELKSQSNHWHANGACLLCEYLKIELGLTERIVFENDSFAVLVPFWAIWPFETLLLPKRHVAGMTELTDSERDCLADALHRTTSRYDRLFDTPFPYSMGFHQRPTNTHRYPEWHLHAHFYPPLLRSATVRKFMVGYEMLGTPQRDITPEAAAARLKEIPDLP